jgi:hypothetical protein
VLSYSGLSLPEAKLTHDEACDQLKDTRSAGLHRDSPYTIPQPSYNDLLTVGINRYSNILSVAIELYRLTLSDAVSGVDINV